jgi:hypothetical protein
LSYADFSKECSLSAGSRDHHEIAQACLSVASTVHQLPGNALPLFVVTAVRQHSTDLLERDLHVSCRPFL